MECSSVMEKSEKALGERVFLSEVSNYRIINKIQGSILLRKIDFHWYFIEFSTQSLFQSFTLTSNFFNKTNELS